MSRDGSDIVMWDGKLIREMSREELVALINFMNRVIVNERARARHERDVCLGL